MTVPLSSANAFASLYSSSEVDQMLVLRPTLILPSAAPSHLS